MPSGVYHRNALESIITSPQGPLSYIDAAALHLLHHTDAIQYARRFLAGQACLWMSHAGRQAAHAAL